MKSALIIFIKASAFIIFSLLIVFKASCQQAVSADILVSSGNARIKDDPGFNAKFIRMDSVPDTLLTDDFFKVYIYMKNTGTVQWSPAPDDNLCEMLPLDTSLNHGWGVPFIYMGQGNGCQPGDTFCMISYLRAPHTPGEYPFRWQMHRRAGDMFGEVTPDKNITIKQRTDTPPTLALRDSVLSFADFEYVGSFALPEVSGFDNRWTESGCTIKRMKDGSKNMLLNTGTYSTTLYEVQIPEPSKIVDNNYSTLPVATFVKNWGPLDAGNVHGEGITGNSGFWYDNSSNILYWSHYNGYYTGNSDNTYGFPSLTATRLDADGQSNIKSFYLPIQKLSKWKGYWSGVTNLSKKFAQTYTGGRDIALGFGGYFSICASASRGPALGAIRKPDINKDTVDMVEMLTYADPQAALRDGDYLTNEGIWSQLPKSPWEGSWGYGDQCRAGVLIDLPDKHGVVMFASVLQGDITYWYGGYNMGSPTQQWYFYDSKDLGEAAQGKKQADLKPLSIEKMHTPQYSLGATVTGACFDSTDRMLYVYNTWALGVYPAGYPAVHVYKVKVNEVTGMQESLPDVSIEVYPNPFNTSFNITIPKETILKDAALKIYDVCGKEVKNISISSHETLVDRGVLQSGIYFYDIINKDEKVANGKLVVQ